MTPRHKHKYRNIFCQAIIQIQTNDWWVCMQVWHIFHEMMKLAQDMMVSSSLATINLVVSIGDREFCEHEIYIKLTVTVELRINVRPFRFLLRLFRNEQSSSAIIRIYVPYYRCYFSLCPVYCLWMICLNHSSSSEKTVIVVDDYLLSCGKFSVVSYSSHILKYNFTIFSCVYQSTQIKLFSLFYGRTRDHRQTSRPHYHHHQNAMEWRN